MTRDCRTELNGTVIERYEEITVYQDRTATGGGKDKNGEKYDVV